MNTRNKIERLVGIINFKCFEQLTNSNFDSHYIFYKTNPENT